MKNFFTSKYKQILLFVILIIAVVLRFGGITSGYPPYHSDEGMSYSQGLAMIREGTLDAHGYPLAYAYPNVVPIINAIFFKFVFIPMAWISFWIQSISKIIDGLIHIPLTPLEYKRIFQLEILGERETNVLIWGRMVTAFFGVATVYLTYVVAQKLFKTRKWIGFIAAFLVAVNYRQVLNSHLDLPDIYNAFFLLASLWATLNVWRNPTKINYLLAGIFCGISFSTKYHIYTLFPLMVTHFYLSFEDKKNFIKSFFLNQSIYLSALSFLATVFLINPFHIINLDETLFLLGDVSGKYSAGKNKLDIYSYWYLYNYGIGKITSIFVLLGVISSFILNFKKTIFVLSLLVSFLVVVTYLTGGGFYTRNFVSITPIVLIFAAYPLSTLFERIRPKLLGAVFCTALLVFISFDNIYNSAVVAKEYTKPWNILTITDWITKNIPANSKVSAHSSVPVHVEGVTILPYEYNISYSLEEFRLDGADYAVTNLDWATSGFYGWMGGSQLFTVGKPIQELEKGYPAMSLGEISDFVVFTAINSWQAPDSHFIVSKVPDYKVTSKQKIKEFSINKVQEKDDMWKSEPMDISDWKGFVIESEIKLATAVRDGFIWVNFYTSQEDAKLERNRLAVRLSARNVPSDNFELNSLVGVIPQDAKYMVFGIGLYDPVSSQIEVGNIKVYNSDVEIDLDGVEVKKIKLDDNLVYPNSHGYL